MADKKPKYTVRELIFFVTIAVLCAVMAILDFVPITYTKNEIINRLLGDTLPLLFGAVAVIMIMARGKSGLFKGVERLWFLLPCLLIAVDNFPFHAYFTGKSEIIHTAPTEWILFALYCLAVGFFEECVFRGVLFPVLAGYFSKDKKGLIKTFFFSSIIFGAVHLFNLFVGGGFGPVIMQVGYSTLIGGLCAFALMKTKNIFCPVLVHALYDFCGLLLDARQGLGMGVVFDWQTAVTMAVIGVAVGVFVLVSVFKTTETEREKLYLKLGFDVVKNDEYHKAGE